MTTKLSDPRSRRAWRNFRLRAEYMLGSLPRVVRRDLLNDLEAHFAEAMRRRRDEGEYELVVATIDRLGDPREFMRPLIAEAVFARPAPPAGIGLLLQGATMAAKRSALELLIFAGLSLAAALGAAVALLGVRRIMAPQSAGLFQQGVDQYQLRLWGSSEALGAQMVPLWIAIVLTIAGACLGWWALRLLARQAMRLVLG